MNQVRLACGLPLCQKPQEAQTNLSVGLRVTAVVLGILAVTIGALILLKIPGLNHFGTTNGWVLASLGSSLILGGTSIKCVRNLSNPTPEPPLEIEEQEPIQEVRQEKTLENLKETLTQETVEVKPHTIQEQILNDFTPQMVEALGGIDKVLEFPKMEDWRGGIEIKDLKAPVMRGYHAPGRPFLLFCYFKYSKDYDRYVIGGEYLGRTKNGWEGEYSYPGELNLRSPNPVVDGSPAARHMLDKITRFMKKEALGVVERFPGIILRKPQDKESWLPKDAYLEGKELEKYMDCDTLFYERKPKTGSSELFLYDPRLSKKENSALYHQKFPDVAERGEDETAAT